MPKKVFRAIYAVNYCIQAGFCMVCPAGLIILGGWLLRTRCGLGRWIMIAAIVFGVFAGAVQHVPFSADGCPHHGPHRSPVFRCSVISQKGG